MDPNDTLDAIRSHVDDVFQMLEDGGIPPETLHKHVVDLAQSVEALDQWISKGGTLPAEWASPMYGCGATINEYEKSTNPC